MSKGEVLITDSLFIFDEHVREIEENGYSVVRLDKPKASEAELCEAIRGKVGYILGGIEKVTDKVIRNADKLKVISFTGAGYTEFIPGFEAARSRGIAITAAKGGNANAVAELAITFALMGLRGVPRLTAVDGESFLTTKSASESVIGVIGYGAIGQKVAQKANEMGFSVLISSRREPKRVPAPMRFVSLDSLLEESDVVSLHVDKLNGVNVLGPKEIAKLRSGAILVNVAFEEAVSQEAAIEAVKSKAIMYLADHPQPKLASAPVGYSVCTNSQTAFNTFSALRKVSNQTTKSMLSVLQTGSDEFRVV
tara:strand:- start:330 stop:1256 length:927 start_codon:yes stop_codon:yes gene_type:complete